MTGVMMRKMRTEMTGKFEQLYMLQARFQEKIEGTFPHDDPKKFQYHMNAMVEEMGEVLKADKRWKTHRNTTYIFDEKMDELADCWITLMNITMWSGIPPEQMIEGIETKIAENLKRLEKETK
jgi:NTP pyrophosphatase (non-canonical NTP hydrolase)